MMVAPVNFQIRGCRTALTLIQISWVQNLGHNSAMSLPNKSTGYEWSDAASD